jgi:hypothetical protein
LRFRTDVDQHLLPELRFGATGFGVVMSAPNQSELQARPRAVLRTDERGEKAMFFASKEDAATRVLAIGAAEMAVAEVGVYRGPHYYSHTPMVRIQLDLDRICKSPLSLAGVLI